MLGLVAAAGVLVGWARSDGRWDDVSVRWGHAAPEIPKTPGAEATWSWRSRTLAITQWSGLLQFRSDVYLSELNDQASLRHWKNETGWRFESMLMGSPKRTVSDHWDGPFNFRWGKFCCERVSKQGVTARVVTAPHWVVAAALAAPGVVLMAGWGRRRKHRLLGRCAGCGYELGGLAQCPECGRAPDAEPRR